MTVHLKSYSATTDGLLLQKNFLQALQECSPFYVRDAIVIKQKKEAQTKKKKKKLPENGSKNSGSILPSFLIQP